MNDSYDCRFCAAPLRHSLVDLGISPLANSFLKRDQLVQMEPFYPLQAYVCESCFLVQMPVFEPPELLFRDYAYFSSYSDSWLEHAKSYMRMMVERFRIGPDWMVIEIGSNDGYLLRFFREEGIPVMGIEPAENVARAAQGFGIPTINNFFNMKLALKIATESKRADLLIGNNVLAHVPDLNDFVAGMKVMLNPRGIVTMEFPHLLRLLEEKQFDTIYHEHFSYFSFLTAQNVFARNGLTIFDVEELPTHGGSLRIYACHSQDQFKSDGKNVSNLMIKEKEAGLADLSRYLSFSEMVKETKRNILEFMIGEKKRGRSIAGYGAPAKGNTLLNYCGIRTDFIDYTVDRNPHKQGLFLPGSRIPIFPPEKIKETRPDDLLILPWNLKEEIMDQLRYLREWKGRFVVLIPEIKVYP
ncbi:MAG: SAM-dependent methyltransferase [Deltaproteobacteria bacterium RBG_16_50_11]|nr:MAG: SAM-dependent methyltransferase [Deltaproteobacteria bacterium RBG_16_50_11]